MTLEILPLVALRFKAFNNSWTYMVSYIFLPAALGPLVLSMVLVEHVTGQLIQTSNSSCTLLDGSSLASHSSQHVGRQSSLVSYCKRSYQRCFSRPGAKRSTVAPFNPLAVQACCTDRFFSSVCQAVIGDKTYTAKVYHQCWTEWIGWCAWQCHICPKMIWFLFHLFRVGLAWHTVGVYHFAYFSLLGILSSQCFK